MKNEVVIKLEKAERWYQVSFVIRRETGRVAPTNIGKSRERGDLTAIYKAQEEVEEVDRSDLMVWDT